MDRFAIFVDAGYFFAAGAQSITGTSVPRSRISIKSPNEMLKSLCERATEVAGGMPLLRAYWYDAMVGSRPSLEQSQLAVLDGVKLRFGILNSSGQQKGVDSLIVTDLIDLARNKAIADAVLIAGDEDIRIAVMVAQSFGVRVHILAAGDPQRNVSPSLWMETDSLGVLDRQWFETHLKIASPPVASVVDTPFQANDPQAGDFDTVVPSIIQSTIDLLPKDHVEGLILHFKNNTTVPPEYDRPLIAQASKALAGRNFSGDEKRSIRGMFISALRRHAGDRA